MQEGRGGESGGGLDTETACWAQEVAEATGRAPGVGWKTDGEPERSLGSVKGIR